MLDYTFLYDEEDYIIIIDALHGRYDAGTGFREWTVV